MNSVSKINVALTTNATQFAAGMGQASAAVGRFSGITSNLQGIAQQATFAVDDFMSQFIAQGPAAGLRAAGNNLTFIAASIGSVHAQLAAIAGISLAQLALNQWARDEQKAMDAAREATEAFRKEMDALRDAVKQTVNVGAERRDIARTFGGDQLRRRQQDSLDTIHDLSREYEGLQQVLNRISPEMVALEFKSGKTDADRERLKLLKEQADETERAMNALMQERKLRQDIVRDIQKQLTSTRAPGVPGDRFGFFGAGAAAKGIKGQLSLDAAKTLDPTRFWGNIPGANAFGTSGAVSTINQAMIGPKNVEAAQLQELKNIARSASDTARALGGKLTTIVEVGL